MSMHFDTASGAFCHKYVFRSVYVRLGRNRDTRIPSRQSTTE